MFSHAGSDRGSSVCQGPGAGACCLREGKASVGGWARNSTMWAQVRAHIEAWQAVQTFLL